jgi:hypothetical protein
LFLKREVWTRFTAAVVFAAVAGTAIAVPTCSTVAGMALVVIAAVRRRRPVPA